MELRTAVALSTTAHAGILVWAMIAGLFHTPDDEDSVQIAEVSVLSAAEFDALVSNAPAAVEPPAPAAPAAPDVASTETPVPRPDTAPHTAQPEAPEAAPPETEPDVAALTPPPQAEVVPEVPEAPASPAEAPDAPVSDTPSPREAPRVAPTPAPAPPPATETAPVVEAPPALAEVEEPVAPAETPAAPEEAAPVIVTEADTPSAAPERSIRPVRRPSRPTPVVAEAEDPAEETPPPAPETPAETASAPEATTSDTTEEPAAIDTSAALEAALGGSSDAEPASSGPPLTQGERDGLRVAVSRCWNLGALSTEASNTRVTIFMELNRDGTPLTNTIRLVGFDGGSQAAANQAYEVGRRAIIRCGQNGFDLPDEKYAQWREIEMTFDPSTMRLR